MRIESEVSILNCRTLQKKDNSGCYYVLDFLDDENVLYNNFISKELHEKILKQEMKRFDRAIVTLDLTKARSGTGFDVFVKDVEKVPFSDKKSK